MVKGGKRRIPVHFVVEPTCKRNEVLISGVDGRRWTDAMLISDRNREKLADKVMDALRTTIKAWLHLERDVEVTVYGFSGKRESFSRYLSKPGGNVSITSPPSDHDQKGFFRVDPKTKKRKKVSAKVVRNLLVPRACSK